MQSIESLAEDHKVLTCTAALAKAYELALGAMPEDAHGRLAKGRELVEAGGVFESDRGHWEVASQSEPGKVYSVNGSCGCDWAFHHPGNRCTHQYAVLLQRKAMQLITASAQAESGDLGAGDTAQAMPEAPAPEPAVPSKRVVPAHFIQSLQGKPFIKFVGLLQMAHDEGLQSLTGAWTYNDAELSLAHAVATFADGRVFAGSGDSTPQNAKNIGLAWRRMALTRAKARALRDALGIDNQWC
jgi:hypothetical protein